MAAFHTPFNTKDVFFSSPYFGPTNVNRVSVTAQCWLTKAKPEL